MRWGKGGIEGIRGGENRRVKEVRKDNGERVCKDDNERAREDCVRKRWRK